MPKNKFLLLLLCCLTLLTSCATYEAVEEPKKQQNSESTAFIKATWLSCYELSDMFYEGTAEAFCEEITQVFEMCKAENIDTLFVQVRPFADALYPSDIFEWSEFALSSSGKTPNYDPLEIIMIFASEYGVSVHAWINPYRVSFDGEAEIPRKMSEFSFSCDAGIYLDPSDVNAQKLVLDGVREILENYAVDGIHIDDYFYPQTNENFDKESYAAYRENGGKLSKTKWRCENVNSLVSAMYSLVHSVKPEAVFSISPAGDVKKNKNYHYADIELWLTQSGYADWIIPQLYYGFEHETKPFERTAQEWLEIKGESGVKLICGLAAYKQGKHDKGAGKGENEWIDRTDVLSRQTDYIRSIGYDGCALFSYSSIK